MIGRPALLAAYLLSHMQGPPDAVTGGPGPPPSVEGGYTFRCESMSGRLRWREDRSDIDSVPTLRDALRVTLLELSIVGRDLPDSSLARARALLASFAWVERVHILCDDQNAHIQLTAMRADEWVDFVEDRRNDRPSALINTINIARNGAVTIDGPAF